MSGFNIKAIGIKHLKVGPFEETSLLRDIGVTPQILGGLCIEEVRIGLETIFQGTLMLEHLPTLKESQVKKFYLSATIPAGSIVYVTIRSFGEVDQYVLATVRAEVPAGAGKTKTYDMEEK